MSAPLQLEPDSPDAHNSYGRALAVAGRLDEAIAQYEEALRLAPELADAHLNLALALRQAGRQQEADAHYREAMRLNPPGPPGATRTTAQPGYVPASRPGPRSRALPHRPAPTGSGRCSSTVNTAPPPGWFATATVPPWASTSAFTTLSPSPRPRCERLWSPR